MNTVYMDSTMPDATRRERLYQGQLFSYSPSTASRAFTHFAAELIADAFKPHEPRRAQYDLPVQEFVSIVAPLKPRFTHHHRSKQLLVELLTHLGCDPDATYFDVPKMRVVSHGGYLTTGVGYALHAHRDTWYSAPLCQVNWWLPIYEIESESTFAFFPRYWERQMPNDSEKFNYFDWNRERKTAAQHVTSDTRFQPHAQEPLDDELQLRIVCPPGGMIVFSGAHLHATVPNTSGVTRFSIDFRTVNLDDLLARRAAPNLDSAGKGSNLRDFVRCSDLSPLPPEVIAMYEDPEAARGRDEDLVFRPSAAMTAPSTQ